MMEDGYTRPQYGEAALLVVPKLAFQAKWRTIIKGGSAIVAYQVDSNTLHAYYEGNLYGAQNLNANEDKAICAYGRMTKRYPTIAQVAAPLEEFDIVGAVSPTMCELQSVDSVKAWLTP